MGTKGGGNRKAVSGTAVHPIRKIPGIGGKTYPLLRNMGISRILTIQQMGVLSLRRVLGESGVSIWRKANGIDDSPVLPFHEQKSMSKERTYQQDTIDMDQLKRTLIGMVDELLSSWVSNITHQF